MTGCSCFVIAENCCVTAAVFGPMEGCLSSFRASGSHENSSAACETPNGLSPRERAFLPSSVADDESVMPCNSKLGREPRGITGGASTDDSLLSVRSNLMPPRGTTGGASSDDSLSRPPRLIPRGTTGGGALSADLQGQHIITMQWLGNQTWKYWWRLGGAGYRKRRSARSRDAKSYNKDRFNEGKKYWCRSNCCNRLHPRRHRSAQRTLSVWKRPIGEK